MLLPFISLKADVTYQNRCHFSLLFFPFLKQLQKALCVCVCVCPTTRSHESGLVLRALRVHRIAVFFTKGFKEYEPWQRLHKTEEAFIKQPLFTPALLSTIVKGEFHLASLI